MTLPVSTLHHTITLNTCDNIHLHKVDRSIGKSYIVSTNVHTIMLVYSQLITQKENDHE